MTATRRETRKAGPWAMLERVAAMSMGPLVAREAEVVASAEERDAEVVASAEERDAEEAASTCCGHTGAAARHRVTMMKPRSQGRPLEIRANVM